MKLERNTVTPGNSVIRGDGGKAKGCGFVSSVMAPLVAGLIVVTAVTPFLAATSWAKPGGRTDKSALANPRVGVEEAKPAILDDVHPGFGSVSFTQTVKERDTLFLGSGAYVSVLKIDQDGVELSVIFGKTMSRKSPFEKLLYGEQINYTASAHIKADRSKTAGQAVMTVEHAVFGRGGCESANDLDSVNSSIGGHVTTAISYAQAVAEGDVLSLAPLYKVTKIGEGGVELAFRKRVFILRYGESLRFRFNAVETEIKAEKYDGCGGESAKKAVVIVSSERK